MFLVFERMIANKKTPYPVDLQKKKILQCHLTRNWFSLNFSMCIYL
jgi:hypothetical protein